MSKKAKEAMNERNGDALRSEPAASRDAVLTDTYVQPVPDKCDRITWRGKYYHLSALKTNAANNSAAGEIDALPIPAPSEPGYAGLAASRSAPSAAPDTAPQVSKSASLAAKIADADSVESNLESATSVKISVPEPAAAVPYAELVKRLRRHSIVGALDLEDDAWRAMHEAADVLSHSAQAAVPYAELVKQIEALTWDSEHTDHYLLARQLADVLSRSDPAASRDAVMELTKARVLLRECVDAAAKDIVEDFSAVSNAADNALAYLNAAGKERLQPKGKPEVEGASKASAAGTHEAVHPSPAAPQAQGVGVPKGKLLEKAIQAYRREWRKRTGVNPPHEGNTTHESALAAALAATPSQS